MSLQRFTIGKMDIFPTEEYDWHIGGFDNEDVDCVQKVLDSA